MRFISLLLTLAIIGYLFYLMFGQQPVPVGSQRAVAMEADRTMAAQSGLPPAKAKTVQGIAIERAKQVREMSRQRVEAADPLTSVGFGN
jgi:Heavy-metal resistance